MLQIILHRHGLFRLHKVAVDKHFASNSGTADVSDVLAWCAKQLGEGKFCGFFKDVLGDPLF